MVKLLIGIHNHQPVGNFGFVLEQAYQSAYLPFVEVLRRHPKIKASMHFSGILYDWMETAHPDYLSTLRSMTDSGQIEILGGGYYEPILALLPETDLQGQVAKMQQYVARRFGARPRGAWLAERVWEPQLAGLLAKAGVEFTVLDDVHFFSSGFSEKDLTGYYTTEHDGNHLKVFPISQRLRYLMPFSSPEKSIEFLKGFESRGGNCALVMADDGEKFGLWPETHELVYKKEWLERLFGLIEQNSAWLQTSTFSEHLDKNPSKGLAYLSTTSYYELSQWALPPEPSNALGALYKATPEKDRVFLRGGYFRNFLSKYPESNQMYRKMLHVSGKAHSSGDDAAALDRVWMSQCNCGYWHGVFGGLYMPHIRTENYRNMIKAEKISCGKSGVEIFGADWDGDGRPELFVESGGGNWYFSPHNGGAMFEWDWKEGELNWSNVLTRRREAYHDAVKNAAVTSGPGAGVTPGAMRAKEKDLSAILCYDWHPRRNLLDHFLHPSTAPADFAKAAYGEQGDFVTGGYSSRTLMDASGGVKVSMSRRGTIWAEDGCAVPAEVLKTVALDAATGNWLVDYEIKNLSDKTRRLWFGVELAFAFSGGQVAPRGEEYGIRAKEFADPVFGKISLSSDKNFNFWTFPLETVSLSEEGFERTYQGTSMLCHHQLDIVAGGSFCFRLEVRACK
jgi:alpha-amylase